MINKYITISFLLSLCFSCAKSQSLNQSKAILEAESRHKTKISDQNNDNNQVDSSKLSLNNPQPDEKEPNRLQPGSKGFCQENSVKRPCTKEELEMINDINKIIERIKNFNKASLKTDFVQTTGSINPSVVMFGENHLATIGKVETLGAINSLATPGDIYLWEGIGRNNTERTKCAYRLILHIYTYWQYQKNLDPDQGYKPELAEKFIEEKKFYSMFNNTINSYDLSSLNIRYLKCFGWDIDLDLSEDYSLRSHFEDRNVSMVEAIKYWTKKGHRVFVVAGNEHLPVMDFLKYQDHLSRENSSKPKVTADNPFGAISISEMRGNSDEEDKKSINRFTNYQYDPKELKDFYSTVNKWEKKYKDSINFSRKTLGATECINNFLQNISFWQLIHRRSVVDPYDDF